MQQTRLSREERLDKMEHVESQEKARGSERGVRTVYKLANKRMGLRRWPWPLLGWE